MKKIYKRIVLNLKYNIYLENNTYKIMKLFNLFVLIFISLRVSFQADYRS